jgi:hypothetical protein
MQLNLASFRCLGMDNDNKNPYLNKDKGFFMFIFFTFFTLIYLYIVVIHLSNRNEKSPNSRQVTHVNNLSLKYGNKKCIMKEGCP